MVADALPGGPEDRKQEAWEIGVLRLPRWGCLDGGVVRVAADPQWWDGG